jgi:hypothetical protein
MIPEDFTTEEFLRCFIRVFNAHSTQSVEKASCHDEPHKRLRPSAARRERHKHIALKVSGNVSHKTVSDAFFRAHGLRINFSFKQNRFVGYLAYLTTHGKKASTDLDLKPATYPPNLDIQAELATARHPGDAPAKEGKKRKRLTFDDVSNVILEGVGDGPIHSVQALESTAATLKAAGNIEMWNFLGTLKNTAEARALVSKAWRMSGSQSHPMWRSAPDHPLAAFSFGQLEDVAQWLQHKHKTHSLVLSGDGGLGKTSLAEALIADVCPGGFWFLDDPDDFREIDGEIQSGHGLVIDEVLGK